MSMRVEVWKMAHARSTASHHWIHNHALRNSYSVFIEFAGELRISQVWEYVGLRIPSLHS